MRHTIVNNLTDSAMGPVYISSTITVNSVTVLDDDGHYIGVILDLHLSVIMQH